MLVQFRIKCERWRRMEVSIRKDPFVSMVGDWGNGQTSAGVCMFCFLIIKKKFLYTCPRHTQQGTQSLEGAYRGEQSWREKNLYCFPVTCFTGPQMTHWGAEVAITYDFGIRGRWLDHVFVICPLGELRKVSFPFDFASLSIKKESQYFLSRVVMTKWDNMHKVTIHTIEPHSCYLVLLNKH